MVRGIIVRPGQTSASISAADMGTPAAIDSSLIGAVLDHLDCPAKAACTTAWI